MKNDIMTKLSEIQSQQQSVLDANTAEIKKYEELEAQARGNMDGMTVKAGEAFKAADVSKYHKALDEKRQNEDAVVMYEAKIAELEKNPLLSEEEYRTMLNTITTEMDSYVAEATKEYAILLEKMLKMRQDLSNAVTKADELISTAQKKLFRDRCGMTTAEGKFVKMPYLQKHYDNTQLLNELYDVTRSAFNKELLSQSHPEEVTGIPKIKRWGTA